MRKFRMFPLFNEDGAIGADSGVEVVPAAEVQNEIPASESGVDTQAAAEPNNFEKAFAKRLAAKEAEWEAKNAEKYKDYDTLKKTTSYFQQRHGYTDLMAMNEDIELAELQDRAAKENVPPEVLKRIDQLEAEAAEGKQLKEQQQKEQVANTYFSNLSEFVKDKGVTKEELNQFMIENNIPYNPEDMAKSFSVALRAMKAEQFEAEKSQFETQKEQFEKEAVKKYLESKKGPKAEGAGSAGVTTQGAPKNFADAEARALARIRAAQTTI